MAKPSAVRTVQAQEPIHWLRTGSCVPVRWSSTRLASPGRATQSMSTAQNERMSGCTSAFQAKKARMRAIRRT
eukprot:scaffold41379_cov71-Phaeocystis_antarctica.AAC.8